MRGSYEHPSKLTDEAKKWLKNNISEYDEESPVKFKPNMTFKEINKR